MNMEDYEILNDIIETRNIQKNTQYSYKFAIKLYTEFNQTSLYNLLEEAEKEEEQGIRWKKRTLKKRLMSYRTYLFENYRESSAKLLFSRIKTIYKHYEIEIHDLPKISYKNTNKSIPLSYNDLPTKKNNIKSY